MAELELHGYLTTGKYYVNDYTIEIERVTGGMKMTVTNGSDGAVQNVTLNDGEKGMTDEEIAEVRALMQTMQNNNGAWQTAESERAGAETARSSAEAARELAENGAAGETDKTKYRSGLYELMLALYSGFGDYEEARDGAAASATAAAASAAQAAASATGSDYTNLYIQNGDTITFDNDGTDIGGVQVSTAAASGGMCAFGYVTDNRKTIRIKIPIAKKLAYVTGVDCTRFQANIANNGGYGIRSTYPGDDGSDYLPLITGILIDKVQNCLIVIIKRAAGFNLTNNDTVSCRSGHMSFTFTVPDA